MGTLHEDLCKFMIISCQILLRIRNVLDETCTENQYTHFIFNKHFLNCVTYKIMWKNSVQQGRTQMTIWHMCFACLIPTATNTHSEYVILTDCPQIPWLHKHTSMLHYMYIACLVVRWWSQDWWGHTALVWWTDKTTLTLCRSYLKPYCMGRKTAFFQRAFKFTYIRNRSPLQEKNHNN